MNREPRSFGPDFFERRSSALDAVIAVPQEKEKRPVEKKDAPIQVFVTASTRDRVNAAAHDVRMSMSEYVRRALEAYLPADGDSGKGAA